MLKSFKSLLIDKVQCVSSENILPEFFSSPLYVHEFFLARWLLANKLTLNMTKTEFMLIGSRQKLNSLSVLPDLEINGTQLNRVDFTKSLGALIDENLTWSNHINTISKKISSGIGSIKRMSRCVPPATLHNIYHGFWVQSHFTETSKSCCPRPYSF